MLALRIAFRYLFSRTRLHAVNYVTALSALAIAVVAMALVCVVSVYNGYVVMILEGTKLVDADVELRDADGRTFDLKRVAGWQRELPRLGAEAVSRRLETKALLRIGQRQWVVDAVGLDSAYTQVYPLVAHRSDDGLFAPPVVRDSVELHLVPLELGAAIQLPLSEAGVSVQDPSVELLFPKRLGFINPLSPASAFQSLDGRVIGQYPPASQETDQSVYLPLSELQEVLDYEATEVSAIAVRLRPEVSVASFISKVKEIYGERGIVCLDRAAQHPDLAYLIRMEKVMTYLILVFILLLAAFNVASSLAMLLLEKQEDTRIFTALGAPPGFTVKVFRRVGLLIALLGSVVGGLLGILICWAQSHWGFIKSGSSDESLALPIDLEIVDLLVIFALVTLISYLISLYPTRFLNKR